MVLSHSDFLKKGMGRVVNILVIVVLSILIVLVILYVRKKTTETQIPEDGLTEEKIRASLGEEQNISLTKTELEKQLASSDSSQPPVILTKDSLRASLSDIEGN